jgi:hypothetical protein
VLYVPRIMRPGPCLLPVRMRFGGLSTMDMKLGSSAGCCARRWVDCDKRLHAGQLETRVAYFFETALTAPALPAWRRKTPRGFIVVIVAD